MHNNNNILFKYKSQDLNQIQPHLKLPQMPSVAVLSYVQHQAYLDRHTDSTDSSIIILTGTQTVLTAV